MTCSHSPDDLYRVMAEVLRISPHRLTPEIAIHKIDTWNSLTHIELVVTLEERFNVQLTEDEIADMTSLGAIERILGGRGVLSREADTGSP